MEYTNKTDKTKQNIGKFSNLNVAILHRPQGSVGLQFIQIHK